MWGRTGFDVIGIGDISAAGRGLPRTVNASANTTAVHETVAEEAERGILALEVFLSESVLVAA